MAQRNGWQTVHTNDDGSIVQARFNRSRRWEYRIVPPRKEAR
jgi:hypothetical protein